MILKVNIDNFKGINKPIEFSTFASNKIKHKSNDFFNLDERYNVLKNIGLIGSNGSGKTSFLSAIESLQRYISFPYRKKISTEEDYTNFIKSMSKEELEQFLIDFNTLDIGEQNVDRNDQDTTLSIEIFVPERDNNISGIYSYNIVYDKDYSKKGIKVEELFYRKKYSSKKKLYLFRKENIIESVIGTSILYENNDIYKNDNDNLKYYKSFFNEMMDYTDCYYGGANINLLDIVENDKDIFVKLCNIADDKIIDVSIDENDKQKTLLFWNKNNNSLKLSQLSNGTRKIIILGCSLIRAFRNNATSLIDEIDSELHPSLVKFLLELNKSNKDYNCSQLIFTTHSPLIAFSLNNDELYFINNHGNNYSFLNITGAIKNKLITKDQNPYKTWVEDLLIKNPDENKIKEFTYNDLKDKSEKELRNK